MKAPISRSRRAKLRAGSTCNEQSTHELDPQPKHILSNSQASGDNFAHTPATGADQVHDLALLVWKYFADEIRETLIEVQQSLGGIDNDRDQD